MLNAKLDLKTIQKIHLNLLCISRLKIKKKLVVIMLMKYAMKVQTDK